MVISGKKTTAKNHPEREKNSISRSKSSKHLNTRNKSLGICHFVASFAAVNIVFLVNCSQREPLYEKNKSFAKASTNLQYLGI